MPTEGQVLPPSDAFPAAEGDQPADQRVEGFRPVLEVRIVLEQQLHAPGVGHVDPDAAPVLPQSQVKRLGQLHAADLAASLSTKTGRDGSSPTIACQSAVGQGTEILVRLPRLT